MGRGRRRFLRSCVIYGALFAALSIVAPAIAGARARQQLRDAGDDEFIGWSGETFDSQHTFGDGPRRGWVQTLSWSPRAFLYHGFASAEEVEHLIELARPHIKRSEVVDNASGKTFTSKDRTSAGTFLRRGQDDVVARLESRIAAWTRLPVHNGEPFHVLHYEAGNQYTAHFDYFHDAVNSQNGGQRVATALIYLSDVDEGGETVFPDSQDKPSAEEAAERSECGRRGVAVRPRKGDCLLFWSYQPDGVTKDAASLHAGCPVCPSGAAPGKRCDKWSATKWIRMHEHKVWD